MIRSATTTSAMTDSFADALLARASSGYCFHLDPAVCPPGRRRHTALPQMRLSGSPRLGDRFGRGVCSEAASTRVQALSLASRSGRLVGADSAAIEFRPNRNRISTPSRLPLWPVAPLARVGPSPSGQAGLGLLLPWQAEQWYPIRAWGAGSCAERACCLWMGCDLELDQRTPAACWLIAGCGRSRTSRSSRVVV
jgi:hypothetical protein